MKSQIRPINFEKRCHVIELISDSSPRILTCCFLFYFVFFFYSLLVLASTAMLEKCGEVAVIDD